MGADALMVSQLAFAGFAGWSAPGIYWKNAARFVAARIPLFWASIHRKLVNGEYLSAAPDKIASSIHIFPTFAQADPFNRELLRRDAAERGFPAGGVGRRLRPTLPAPNTSQRWRRGRTAPRSHKFRWPSKTGPRNLPGDF